MTIYKPGDVIVRNGKAIVHTVHPTKKGFYCDECLMKKSKLKLCAGCSQMFYCSRECQVENWKDCHKYECKIFKKMIDSENKFFIGDMMNMMCLRFCLKTHLDKDIGNKKWRLLPEDRERTIEDLTDGIAQVNKKLQDCDRLKKLMPLMIIEEIMKLDIGIDSKTALKRCRQVSNNSGSIRDEYSYDQGETYAIGLFIEKSVFKHSCQPNAIVVFDGPNIRVNVIKDIDTSIEEITLSYINPQLYSTLERKKRIRVTMLFNCRCKLCSVKNNLDKDLLKSDRLVDEMTNAYNANKLKLANSKSNKVELIYRKYFGDFNIPLLNLFRCQLDFYSKYKAGGDVYSNQQYHKLLDMFKGQAFVIYGQDHPFTKKCLANYGTVLNRDDELPTLMELHIKD